MTTILDTPIIETTETIFSTQRISEIKMDILDRLITIQIVSYDDSGLNSKKRNLIIPFEDIPDGTVKDDFIDVLINVRAFARTKGLLGAGTDTNEF